MLVRRRLVVALVGAVAALLVGLPPAAGAATPAALAAPTAPAAPAVPAPRDGCPEVEAIAVRGSNEPRGGGFVAGPVTRGVQDRSPQTVRTHDLVYPALLVPYEQSVAAGVRALRARLAQTSSACGDTTFALVGYSQGAQVIGDTIRDAGVPGGDRVDAVVFFGDPTFRGSEPYNTGSFRPERNGLFPRPAGQLDRYADALRSYCKRDDNVCQAGAVGAGHFRYPVDRDDAVRFVLGRIGD